MAVFVPQMTAAQVASTLANVSASSMNATVGGHSGDITTMMVRALIEQTNGDNQTMYGMIIAVLALVVSHFFLYFIATLAQLMVSMANRDNDHDRVYRRERLDQEIVGLSATLRATNDRLARFEARLDNAMMPPPHANTKSASSSSR